MANKLIWILQNTDFPIQCRDLKSDINELKPFFEWLQGIGRCNLIRSAEIAAYTSLKNLDQLVSPLDLEKSLCQYMTPQEDLTVGRYDLSVINKCLQAKEKRLEVISPCFNRMRSSYEKYARVTRRSRESNLIKRKLNEKTRKLQSLKEERVREFDSSYRFLYEIHGKVLQHSLRLQFESGMYFSRIENLTKLIEKHYEKLYEISNDCELETSQHVDFLFDRYVSTSIDILNCEKSIWALNKTLQRLKRSDKIETVESNCVEVPFESMVEARCRVHFDNISNKYTKDLQTLLNCLFEMSNKIELCRNTLMNLVKDSVMKGRLMCQCFLQRIADCERKIHKRRAVQCEMNGCESIDPMKDSKNCGDEIPEIDEFIDTISRRVDKIRAIVFNEATSPMRTAWVLQKKLEEMKIRVKSHNRKTAELLHQFSNPRIYDANKVQGEGKRASYQH